MNMECKNIVLQKIRIKHNIIEMRRLNFNSTK